MEKVVNIQNIKDKQSDFAFWKTKSHKERLEAIEFLRQQYIKTQKDAEPRLQRVCKVIDMDDWKREKEAPCHTERSRSAANKEPYDD